MTTTTIDQTVRAIWGSALSLEPSDIEPDKTFFELGGYSLLAIQLVQRINQELGLACPLNFLLEHTTLAKVTPFLEKLLEERVERPEVATSPQSGQDAPLALVASGVVTDEPFALTDLQQAYWIGERRIYQLDGPAVWYIEYSAPELDVERFRGALDALVARHPMLRAVFTDDAHQKILPQVPTFPLRVEDLRGQDPKQTEERLSYWRERTSTQFGPLGKWPLFEVCALRLADHWRVFLNGRLIVQDGRSGEIFANDLKCFYEGREEALPPLTLTYPEYQAFVRAEGGSSGAQGAAETAREYWHRRLESLPPAPELPKRSAARQESSRMQRLTGALDKTQWKAFKATVARLGITPTVGVCLAYSHVLSRWSGSNHFTLNVMYGNRRPLHPDVNNILGNFSDTLLLEVQLSGQSLAARGQRLQKQIFEDMQHTSSSGVSLIREITRRRGGGSDAPVMPIVFASGLGLDQGVDDDDKAFFLENLGWRQERYGIQTTQVLLDHQIVEHRGGLVVQWDFRESLLPPGMVGTMFEAYLAFLRTLAEGGLAVWQGEVPDFDLSTQLAVRGQANLTSLELPVDRALFHGFVERTRERPDHPAVISEGKALSYREVYASAQALAKQLSSAGVKAGEPVLVLDPKGPAQICNVLGILLAGGAYVPVSADSPVERIRSIVTQCDARFAVGVRDDVALAGALQAMNIEPIAGSGGANTLDPSFVPHAPAPEQLAYVIYTSGTTGVPKGVAIAHRAAVNTILDVNRRFAVTGEDRVLAVSELNFDLSVYDIFGLFEVGGTLVLPAADLAKNPVELARLVAEHGVTIWNTVPAFMDMLVEFVAHRAPTALTSLRLVLMSGDWIPIGLPDRIVRLTRACRIVSLGGATEASIWSNYFPIDAVDPSWTSIPYGYPLANQRFHVLDDDYQHAPDWVPGQLFIAGDGLAMGYYRDPDRTAERFPHHPRTGERLYNTGDWGRYWPDGTLEFLGRRDTQVKIRGHRIELGDVEAALVRHPTVRDAVVVAAGQVVTDRKLVGYFSVNQGATADLLQLKQHLESQLPSYMVPSELRELAAIPLTANGKIDRKALERAGTSASASRPGIVAPETETAKQIHAIWRDILGTEGFGIKENFFDLGGHSIAALRMVNRLEKQLGVDLPVTLVHENPTIEKLSQILAESRAHRWRAVVPLREEIVGASELFCVHPVGGNIFCYWELAKLWQEGNLYGIQARGTQAGLPPQPSIEEMAETYVGQILERTARRSVSLLGWSMGGLIALEMARLLSKAGKQPRVVLLDTWVARGGAKVQTQLELLRLFFGDLAGGGPPLALAEGDLESALRAGRDALSARNLIAPEMDLSVLRRFFELFAANHAAIIGYQPRPIDAELLLLNARHRDSDRFPTLEPLLHSEAWRDHLRLSHRELDADHFTIVRPETLAARLGEISRFFAGEK